MVERTLLLRGAVHRRGVDMCSLQLAVCVTLAAYCYGLVEQVRRLPDEQRLLQHLFQQYDNSVRPVFNAKDNVVVTFGLTLIQIMDMDEKNQVLMTNAWLVHEWKDQRMVWDPDDFGGTELIRIPSSKLWLPDIVLYNNADDYTTGYMLSNAMVDYNGTVFWSPPARLLSSCKVITTFFPFDEQRCSMKFGSWTYDQAQVDIVNNSDQADRSNYVTNGEWSLVATEMIRNEVVYPIGDAVYPDVTVTIVIKRRILYYVLNIICPCVWMNILSLLAFCLPPDAGEKITLGITVLLSYSVFMLLVAENMPPTSEFIPLIGIYLTISMSLTSFSVILTVIVLKLHHCSPHQLAVPPLLRTVVLKWLAKVVRCNFTDLTSKQRLTGTGKDWSPRARVYNEQSDVCLRLVNDCQHSPIAEIRGHNRCRPAETRANCNHGDTDYYPEQRHVMVLEEILRCLRILVAKRDQDDAEDDVVNEWRQVAIVIDKFLFRTFLLITFVTTLLIMVVYPLAKNN